MPLLSSADFFPKISFSKYSLRNNIRVSNGLNQYPDLGPNCLQRLSADKKKLPLARKYACEIVSYLMGLINMINEHNSLQHFFLL